MNPERGRQFAFPSACGVVLLALCRGLRAQLKWEGGRRTKPEAQEEDGDDEEDGNEEEDGNDGEDRSEEEAGSDEEVEGEKKGDVDFAEPAESTALCVRGLSPEGTPPDSGWQAANPLTEGGESAGL